MFCSILINPAKLVPSLLMRPVALFQQVFLSCFPFSHLYIYLYIYVYIYIHIHIYKNPFVLKLGMLIKQVVQEEFLGSCFQSLVHFCHFVSKAPTNCHFIAAMLKWPFLTSPQSSIQLISAAE